jgi:hypothetical protein
MKKRSVWRNGNRNPRAIYCDDKFIGCVDTEDQALLVSRAVNSYCGWADDETLMCITDDYQMMLSALRKIIAMSEHDSPIHQIASRALPDPENK